MRVKVTAVRREVILVLVQEVIGEYRVFHEEKKMKKNNLSFISHFNTINLSETKKNAILLPLLSITFSFLTIIVYSLDEIYLSAKNYCYSKNVQ